jgi:hypothetical protein
LNEVCSHPSLIWCLLWVLSWDARGSCITVSSVYSKMSQI